jgi:hypothetical protein
LNSIAIVEIIFKIMNGIIAYGTTKKKKLMTLVEIKD